MPNSRASNQRKKFRYKMNYYLHLIKTRMVFRGMVSEFLESGITIFQTISQSLGVKGFKLLEIYDSDNLYQTVNQNPKNKMEICYFLQKFKTYVFR